MKRAPIVVVATAAGLAGVLSFHTKAAPLTPGGLPEVPAAGSPTTSVAGGSPPGRGSSGAGSSPPTTPIDPTTTVPATTPTTSAPSTTPTTASRSATGPMVNYNYGALSVSVTVSAGRITDVRIASLDDGGNFRSQSIDQESIPLLEQQAMEAQSANIQGVSGASYTSAGFEQSLHGALGKLGLS